MFKLESYIAPILLSYVDKYIKNFRLEDSQVSLWGGDASFHNLDLRLEVLEQELQSPFSFISGHIRELLIHVPWTKLTSEPITITINTIECVLKLKDANDGVTSDSSPTRDKHRKHTHKHEVEAPPNYVQLLINKIVSNIRIFCNNLILKYVEEDIVLSMNVKHLKVESCNEKWEAAYTDISPPQVTMRKVISVNDLTVCLDKRNASGKIDFYQEPMLYRCSMTMHMLRTYNSSTSNKTSLTRLDIYCNNMEFSMTEQQVPMFIRLLMLLSALQQKQLKTNNDALENPSVSSENKESGNNTETWAGWAWSYVSSVLPTQWDENLENEQFLNQSGHIIQVGFYVDNASLAFKVSETTHDKGYYTQKKVRYYPLLVIQLQGIYSEMISIGRKWSNLTFGISEIQLLPVGNCSCAQPETVDGVVPYLSIGSKSSSHKSNSLFDAEAVENSGQGQYRPYNSNWDFHMFTNTDSVLLERSPAFACDYLYQMEVPEDTTSDILSDLGSNLEYSNMAEKASVRISVGPLKFRICSGFFHRSSTLQIAASTYDYPPYYTPKPEPPLHDLLPPSEEDFDALSEFIPSRTVRIMILRPVLELQFMDHPFFEATKTNLFNKKAKKHGQGAHIQLEKLPKVTVECKSVEIVMFNPMYVNRLIHTTCQLPEPPPKMFGACFTKLEVNVVGLGSRLVLKQNNYTTLIVPFNWCFQSKSILSPQYWVNHDTMHSELNFRSESLTFNCTKAKLIVVSHLINNVLKRDPSGLKSLRYTSLLYDASKDYTMPYLELYVEGVRFKKTCTNSTVSIDAALDSVKAFVFESHDSSNSNEIQQVLFLSGPEPKAATKSTSSFAEELPLLIATIQYPLAPETQAHPSLVIFNLQEINVCVDPLVCKWLLYHPMELGTYRKERHFMKNKSFSEIYGSASETARRSSTQIESVHSSSDREAMNLHQVLPKIEEEAEKDQVDLQEKIYDFLKTWHPVWKSMILSGHVSQCILYFPMASISAVGSQGVEGAIKDALKKKLVPNVMVITLPFANIHSAQKQNVVKYLKDLPAKLPDSIWSVDRSSFPWTMSISDLNCYSMEPGEEIAFLKTVGISATVGLSTKSPLDTQLESASIGSLGVYVHIDVTPILISVSETQMYLLGSLVYGLSEFFDSLTPKKSSTECNKPDPGPSVVTIASPSLSPTAKDHTHDDTSGTIAAPDLGDAIANSENVKLTAWVQWTITKFSVELQSHDDNSQLKLVIDVEDIVSSLDYQNVYLKMKSKIGSIAVQHYRRSNDKSKWQRGPLSGVVLRLREDVPIEKTPEESGFIGITITRASSQHTHNLWGTLQKTKSEKKANISRYITEIVVCVQPIDLVISPKTLLGFYSIVAPFIEHAQDNNGEAHPKATFTNQALPLAYLECHEIRVIAPSVELCGANNSHDVVVLQVEKISLTPSVVNPICRTPLRPDIYRQAAQARILSIPGSELEDRQYQLDVAGMSVSTTAWKDLEHVLNMRGNVVRGINENPALEWNNLKQGKLTIVPTLNLKQVVDKFDISVIAAPTMIYKSNIIICSTSFEINIVSDISIFLSLEQLKLARALFSELSLPTKGEIARPEITYPYTRFDVFKSDLESELTEFYKDSGIDTSEIRSVLSSKSQTQQSGKDAHKVTASPHPCNQIPLEILFTAGKISSCLYQTFVTQTIQSSSRSKKHKYVDEEDRNYEASEEESVDEVMKRHKKYLPLVFVCVSQPSAYLSSDHLLTNTNLSCFDLGIKLNDCKCAPISSPPTSEDFPVDLITTRSGQIDSATGIPPAFFTLKFSKEHDKPSSFYVDVSRPTKFACSTAKITNLLALKTKLLDCFPDNKRKVGVESAGGSTYRQVREFLKGVEVVQVNTDQLVLSVETEHNLEANLVVNKSTNRLLVNERPEKIVSRTALDCVSISVINEGVKRVLLNPWTVSFTVAAFMESWQISDNPQVHVAVKGDCLMLDVGPEQLVHVERIVKEAHDFMSYFTSPTSSAVQASVKTNVPDKEQHYKDDLRAGAFQFIEANEDELPLPYQVVFWTNKQASTMAWRYPQPRALTKVRIFPVPLEISIDSEPVKVTCALQYWSEYQSRFLPYASFSLSESEVCYLNLPKGEPQRAVACIWQVVLGTVDSSGKKVGKSVISPRALAACMRVDSYFNKSIVPNLTTDVFLSKVEVSLISGTNKRTATLLPASLKQFASDQAFPESHCFLKIVCTDVQQHLESWDLTSMFIDLQATIKSTALDYTYLTEQTLIEEFVFKIEASLVTKLSCSVVSNPIQLVFGPTLAHTLTVNSHLWSQNSRDFAVFTRYVVCNDTNINLRFGQVGTDEDVLLSSRCFHLYCWRSQKSKRKLRVAFEERGWLWSKPFKIHEDGIQLVSLGAESNLQVIVSVKALSTTQKLIVIGGQFVIANMLLEHFEFKIVPESRDEKEVKRAAVHVLGGKTITPSMFIDSRHDYYFRLRFFGLESAWTGDIPLKEHTKGAQPWLVKVPLQERGQFLSIWCRIVVQDCQKGKRILAMLWPLFMVKSNLPITSNIHIETPTLNVHLESSVKGKGELQQLYCPGTIDHSHQLTFKLHDGTSISDPYIPLNYSLVDQQKFFKKTDKENVDEIVESLRDYDVPKWPYFGEDLENVEWIVDDQPQTIIQVRYQNACLYSSALLVELLPWCLMVNTFGCPISLSSNGTELCKIGHYGIVAPPKLDDNFHLGIDFGSGTSYSPPLQLSTSDWSQSFYMPRISGTLPPDGSVKTTVKSGRDMAVVSITSTINDQIRLLKISSTHVFSNYLTNQVQVVCLAVAEGDKHYTLPTNLDKLSFSVAPQLHKTNSGISIIRWIALDGDDANVNYCLYVSFCFQYEFGWSCPIRVDDGVSRRSFSIMSSKNKSIPLVLTLQERKGQTFLSLFHDDCPQTLIDNKSATALLCAQAVNESGVVAPTAQHFTCFTRIESGTSVFYNMPFLAEKFPELPQICFSERIVFAVPTQNPDDLEWSTPVSITSDSEQFVKVHKFGDVKLVVRSTAFTTLLSVESVSEVEISAIDIRGRLSESVLGKNSLKHDAPPSKSLSQLSLYKSLFLPTIPVKPPWASIEIFAYVKSFNFVFLSDYDEDLQRRGVASLMFDDIAVEVCQKDDLRVSSSILDVQFDNEFYSQGSYDFPVVLVRQEEKAKGTNNVFAKEAKELIRDMKNRALLVLDLVVETWTDERSQHATGVKEVKMKLSPLSVYIEDLYINKLVDYCNNLFPVKLLVWSKSESKSSAKKVDVRVPELVYWQSSVMAKPLTLKSISIEPLSLLLSVHCSLKMYIALDQSPLQFGRFERRRLITTPYRLGHAMTMHYLSGAIFGAGWVVSSLELLGSPSGLARAMGTGLRDFINLPYRGLIQGPWAFLAGVTHGSASLMKHVTAGTLQSVTKLASSVARNLDRLTLDEEHLKRTEEQRRQKPQGVTQGFMQGLTGLGISLLGAVGGIAHHPLQSIMADGASPRSLAAGVGLGLVGIITKPLSGAAELVALTGQGLLQGAGWNPLPQPRSHRTILTDGSALVKYEWKLLHALSVKKVLYAIDADVLVEPDLKKVGLVLTSDALIVVGMEEDAVKRIISLAQVVVSSSQYDASCFTICVVNKVEESVVEMDPVCRARVADYVRSTASLLQLPGYLGQEQVDGAPPGNAEKIQCFVNPQNRNYFVCLLALAKHANSKSSFAVL